MTKFSFYLSHIIFIIIVMLMPVIDAPTPNPTSLLMFRNPYVKVDMALHVFCLLYGYFHYYVLIPHLYIRRSGFVYFCAVLLLFLLMSSLPMYITPEAFARDKEDLLNGSRIHILIQIRHIFYLFTAFTLLGVATRLAERNRKIADERNYAELKYLKAQINPHFLFNSLNSIYVQMQTNVPKAGDTLIKLSGIMRYVLKIADANEVSLAQEIHYIEQYLDLQKVRMGDTLTVDYISNGAQSDLKIIPLLLIPFVENAFKYGINPDGPTYIRIESHIQENDFSFRVANTRYMQTEPFIDSMGKGVSITRSRLELSYPDAYTLSIQENCTEYVVELRISL